MMVAPSYTHRKLNDEVANRFDVIWVWKLPNQIVVLFSYSQCLEHQKGYESIKSKIVYGGLILQVGLVFLCSNRTSLFVKNRDKTTRIEMASRKNEQGREWLYIETNK